MKSSPLSNRRTVNPPETSKSPVDLRTRGSSSTRQTISEERFSGGVTRICVIAPFSMWDRAIMPHITPYRWAEYWTLVLCGFKLAEDCPPWPKPSEAARCAEFCAPPVPPPFCEFPARALLLVPLGALLAPRRRYSCYRNATVQVRFFS